MPDRREFLLSAAGSTLMDVHATAESPQSGGLIPRETEPPNLETPAAALLSPVTPADQFYVRNHFPTPAVNAPMPRHSFRSAAISRSSQARA